MDINKLVSKTEFEFKESRLPLVFEKHVAQPELINQRFQEDIFDHETYYLINQFNLMGEQRDHYVQNIKKTGAFGIATAIGVVGGAAFFPDGLGLAFAYSIITGATYGALVGFASQGIWKKIAHKLPKSQQYSRQRKLIKKHFLMRLSEELYQHQIINYIYNIINFLDTHLGDEQGHTIKDLKNNSLILKDFFVSQNYEAAWNHLFILNRQIHFIVNKYETILKIKNFNDIHDKFFSKNETTENKTTNFQKYL